MNSKIFFDLDTVDSRHFVDKLRSVNFVVKTPYCIDIFVVPSDRSIAKNSLKRFSHKRVGSDSLFWISTIPFVLHSTENLDEKLKSLFVDIFIAASYADIGKYCVGGECYNKAFCIEVYRSV